MGYITTKGSKLKETKGITGVSLVYDKSEKTVKIVPTNVATVSAKLIILESAPSHHELIPIVEKIEYSSQSIASRHRLKFLR